MIYPDDYINQIICGDCLDVMKGIPDKSIDMVLCDLPYGTTQCKWDVIIPFEPLWKQYERIIKDNSAIVLTSSQPFTSLLVTSNLPLYKYEWIWEKSKASGFLDARRRPLKAHENIAVFSRGRTMYYPQKSNGKPYSGEKRAGKLGSTTDVYNKVAKPLIRNGSKDGSRFPRTVVYFATAEAEGKQYHPTQKSVALFEYLIRTYTNEGDLVLDNCIGSGTTALACINTNRRFIGIDNDPKYCEIARQRVANLPLILDDDRKIKNIQDIYKGDGINNCKWCGGTGWMRTFDNGYFLSDAPCVCELGQKILRERRIK